ncbi:efflux RND transporter periplasmic adaptor subunit [Tunturiibacter empetritectus]|uniref:Multidrug efflux system membrane fusion protein n=2 Tax=Tunturiibacter TaxID=3154218 RepID=A0A852VNI2_9BACT|nr:efflux RND transporter periplasmic adaptor subunit [Edaphobacter lichenicola]NYF91136.1 multidrug efflux system membrane fusion protein [Edaphobacter lichenicola]
MNRLAKPGRLWVAALANSLVLALAACKQENPATTLPLPVHTAVVQSVSAESGTKYSANIVPYAQVDLSFKSNGYVERIHQVKSPSGGMRNVDQGDWVPKGTVLALVSQQDYSDKLQQAQAQLARGQAEQEKAKLSFDRVSSLYSTQSATKPDYDSAKAQMDSTTASVSGAQAQISEAKVALAYCSLRAPFNGWLVKRSVDLGSLVGPATNGFTLADTSSVKAVFGVPDILISRVRLGQHLIIATDALSHPVEGRVSAISPAADPKSRVFSVEVTIPNQKDELKSGMIASLSLDGASLQQPALVVPLSAVIRDPSHADGFAVMAADGSGDLVSARLQPVDLGDTSGNMIVVKGGLTSGERVITTGVTLIKSGDKVRVIP